MARTKITPVGHTPTPVEDIGPAFGLLSISDETPLADVALTGVDVDVNIKDVAYSARFRYRFRNTGEAPLEARYLFPVFGGAAVCGFEARIGERVVEGQVMESGDAQKVYDDAIAEGHGAYKLDRAQNDAFEMAVGNIPPSIECEIAVTVVGMTEPGEGDVPPGTNVFRLPTTVAPRYTPQRRSMDPPAATRGQREPPSLCHSEAGEVGYAMSVRVAVKSKSRIVHLSCHSHEEASVEELSGGREEARLSLEGTPLDRDFVMSYALDGSDEPRIWVEVPESSDSEEETQEEGGTSAAAAAMVCLQPDLRSDGTSLSSSSSSKLPAEYVFVLDRSGSMSGQSIATAREAVAEALRCLDPASTFNVVSFGSVMELMHKKPKAATPSAVKAAVNKLRRMEADLGGTEIINPLKYALTLPRPSGVLGRQQRQIFFLTDGSVWNQDDCFALVRKHSQDNRVFSFGIGPCASSSLVKGVAKAGRGTATFVDSADMSPVVQQVKLSMEPCVVVERLEWSPPGSSEPTNVELDPVPIFHGQRLVLFFIAPFDRATPVRQSSPATCNVRLCLQDGTGTSLPPLPIAGPAETGLKAEHGTCLVSRLAALDRVSLLSDRSLLSSDDEVKRTCREEIVRLGVRYQVATDHTSFVAVEKREGALRVDPSRLQKQQVPNALPTTGKTYPPGGGAKRARSRHEGRVRKKRRTTSKPYLRLPEPTSYGVASASSRIGAVGDFRRAFLGPASDADGCANDCWLDSALGMLIQIEPLRDELLCLACQLAPGGDRDLPGSLGATLGQVMRAWQRLLRTATVSSRRALDVAKSRLLGKGCLPSLGFVYGQTYSLEDVLSRLLRRLDRDGVKSAGKVCVVSDLGRHTVDSILSGGRWRWMMVVGVQASGVLRSLKMTPQLPLELVAFASAENISLLSSGNGRKCESDNGAADDEYAWHYTIWSPDRWGGYWVYDDLMGPVPGCRLGIQGGYVPPSAVFAGRALDSASDSASAVLLTKKFGL